MVTYGEGHVPTLEKFEEMTQVIEGYLDKIQRNLKRLIPAKPGIRLPCTGRSSW